MALARSSRRVAVIADHVRAASGTIERCYAERPTNKSLSRPSAVSAQGGSDDVDLDSLAYGFMGSQALFGALELGLFDAIHSHGPGGCNLDALRESSKIAAPRLQTLLTALCAVKCLQRSDAGHYTLSPNTARHMVSTSPGYYGDYLKLQIGRQFYHTMGALPRVMATGKAPDYDEWFSDPDVAKVYTTAQHNGSVATARQLVKKKISLEGVKDMLDVGGGSGAFSYVFAEAAQELRSTVLELPNVCRTGEVIRDQQSSDVRNRVSFRELNATKPDWPVEDSAFDVVLMSYISGSVPEPLIQQLYANAWKALRPGGRLLVHDFMVDDDLRGPTLGALWALQHVTVNAEGLGLCPREVISRMGAAGFPVQTCTTQEMIHGLTKLIIAQKI
eukprot:TRINITY_DN11263_c0_g1_i1.p1 TRINITY_DN11263_c0_g1~~TRINITY_DN11263_c0_g1_i1.p1  ORF type:complete len:407 (+),score=60.79 TRINITY_DN11263_c0_g1_i1:55-1221(+)